MMTWQRERRRRRKRRGLIRICHGPCTTICYACCLDQCCMLSQVVTCKEGEGERKSKQGKKREGEGEREMG